ncbi:NTP transferase domain-containing protein [bacterium]|nr:NTP transferase domain-containing protein [bacterium]
MDIYAPPQDFRTPINAVLLTGGRIKDLPESEPQTAGKGHIMIGSKPMSAHTLAALRASKYIDKIILVSDIEQEKLAPVWEGVYKTAPTGKGVIDSVQSGLKLLPSSSDPVLLAAGDLPFLTTEAVDNFIEQCLQNPKQAVWYAFVNKKDSQAKYPELRHTWIPLAEGTFCGGGFSCMRADAFDYLLESMKIMAEARKKPLKMARILGFKVLFNFLIRRLTIPMIQETVVKIAKMPCCGIMSPFAESAYNVDDAESLGQARRRMQELEAEKN